MSASRGSSVRRRPSDNHTTNWLCCWNVLSGRKGRCRGSPILTRLRLLWRWDCFRPLHCTTFKLRPMSDEHRATLWLLHFPHTTRSPTYIHFINMPCIIQCKLCVCSCASIVMFGHCLWCMSLTYSLCAKGNHGHGPFMMITEKRGTGRRVFDVLSDHHSMGVYVIDWSEKRAPQQL